MRFEDRQGDGEAEPGSGNLARDRLTGAIQLFDLVWVITQGGPDHHSETMAVTMFQYGFKRYQVGYASAISVVMFGICLVFALAYQRFVLRRDLEGATTNMRGDGR